MNLFAILLELNREAIKSNKITDYYSLHRVVYNLFEDVRTETDKITSMPSGIQWVDKGGNSLSRKILIIANRKPIADTKHHGKITVKTISQDFLSYQRYQFEVVMNPVRRDHNNKKRVPIRGKDDIANWFDDRSSQWGFAISRPHLQVNQVSIKQFTAKEQEITIQQARITGYLTVVDQQKFVESVSHGIGRGRSFGCGLLQLVPVV